MTGRGRNKGLSEADRALWEKVVEGAEPLSANRPVFSRTANTAIPISVPTPREVKPFQIGQSVKPSPSQVVLKPSIDEEFAKTSPNMDGRSFQRLKKGKLPIDAKIDLHGMTLAEAHPRLIGFIQNAFSARKRLVLVVTGKGKSMRNEGIMPARRGVLKHQVPQWLTMAPLAPMVLQVTQATRNHGGTGAYYVYLRRQR